MIINYFKNINFISLTIIFTMVNLGLNSSLVEAKPGNKMDKSVFKLSCLEHTDNQSLNQNLLMPGNLSEQIEQISLKKDDFEISNREQTIPLQDKTLIASSFSGQASWYGPGFHGRLTANGERYNQNAMTAAHPSLKFGTRVKVTNLNNGRSVVVRINDRGPFVGGRVIDLSAAAARSLNMINSGVAPVKVTILRR